MYANIVADASFWFRLVEIDEQLQQQTISRGCSRCGGRLHVANYPRKPRGVPEAVEDAFSQRLSTCCGQCRRRRMPTSVRFLGRRVYAGIIVVLAAMGAIVSTTAVGKTLRRWVAWWTDTLPRTSFWVRLQGRLIPAVDMWRLPASLLERLEAEPGKQTEEGLVRMLLVLRPLTTRTGASTHDEGEVSAHGAAQKMASRHKRGLLLPRRRAPTTPI